MNAAPWSYTNRFHSLICDDHTKCKITPGSEMEFHADLIWRVTWKNKLQTSTIHVSQDTLSIQTDCFVILSCYTAGNFITQFCDCDRPQLWSEAMQVNLQVEATVLHNGGGTSVTHSSPLDSALPQSSSTVGQNCCACRSQQLPAEKRQLRSWPLLGV